MKAVCNRCQEIVDAEYKEEIIGQDGGDDVIRAYINCPSCGYKATTCIMDKTYKAMQRYYQQLTNSLRRAIIQNQSQATINAIAKKQHNHLEKTMKPYQKQLREKYETRSNEDADQEHISNT